MSEGVQTTVSADARTLRALLMLIQRIPMTDLEALAIEDLFARWFRELSDQTNPPIVAGDQWGPEGPPDWSQSMLEALAGQQVPTPVGGVPGAASDVLSDQPEAADAANGEGPPDAASGPTMGQTDQG